MFTSNFFQHLPEKRPLSRTRAQAHRRPRRGGRATLLRAYRAPPSAWRIFGRPFLVVAVRA